MTCPAPSRRRASRPTPSLSTSFFRFPTFHRASGECHLAVFDGHTERDFRRPLLLECTHLRLDQIRELVKWNRVLADFAPRLRQAVVEFVELVHLPHRVAERRHAEHAIDRTLRSLLGWRSQV